MSFLLAKSAAIFKIAISVTKEPQVTAKLNLLFFFSEML